MIPDRVKRQADKAWDRVRADAKTLEKREAGAGERYLTDATAALEQFRAFRLSGSPTGRPR